jgi:hypothetical protein
VTTGFSVVTKADILADHQNQVENYQDSQALPSENHINIMLASGAESNLKSGDLQSKGFRLENQRPGHDIHENVLTIDENNAARVLFDQGNFVLNQNTAKTEKNPKVVPTSQVLNENGGLQTENYLDTVKLQKTVKRTDPALKSVWTDPGRGTDPDRSVWKDPGSSRPLKTSKVKAQLSFYEKAVHVLVVCVFMLGIFWCWRQAYATKRRPAPRKKPSFLCAVNFTLIWPCFYLCSVKLYTILRDSMQYLNAPTNHTAKLVRAPKNPRRQKSSEEKPNSWIKAALPSAPTGLGLGFPGSAAEFVQKRIPPSNRSSQLNIRNTRTEAAPLGETLGKAQANGRSSVYSSIDDPRSGGWRGIQKPIRSKLTVDRFGSALVEPCGLYNGYNSDANLCFMNSALQLIFHSVKDFGADLGRCEGAVAKAVRVIGEAAFEACRSRQNCLSQVADRIITSLCFLFLVMRATIFCVGSLN